LKGNSFLRCTFTKAWQYVQVKYNIFTLLKVGIHSFKKNTNKIFCVNMSEFIKTLQYSFHLKKLHDYSNGLSLLLVYQRNTTWARISPIPLSILLKNSVPNTPSRYHMRPFFNAAPRTPASSFVFIFSADMWNMMLRFNYNTRDSITPE